MEKTNRKNGHWSYAREIQCSKSESQGRIDSNVGHGRVQTFRSGSLVWRNSFYRRDLIVFSFFFSPPSYSFFHQKILVVKYRYPDTVHKHVMTTYKSAQILVVNVSCNQIHWFSWLPVKDLVDSRTITSKSKSVQNGRSIRKCGYINCISDFCFLSYDFVLIRLIEKHSSRASACYVIAAIVSFSKREIQWNVSNFVCTVASLWYLLLANLYRQYTFRNDSKKTSASLPFCSLILYLPCIRDESRLYSAYTLAKDARIIME